MLVPIVCLLFSCGIAQADSLQVWHPRNPLPTQYTLRGVAYGNGTYVAVGIVGTILNSSNGIDWAVCNSRTNQNLNAITFGKGRFVVGGDKGVMLWSTNGVNWTNASVPVATHNIDGLGYGTGTNFPDGLFVAMVSSNYSGTSYDVQGFYSSNAVDWYLSSPPTLPRAPHRSIASGNDRFLASATRTTTGFPDGAYWSPSGKGWGVPLGAPIGPVAFGNGLFMVASGFVTTGNGVILNSATTANPAQWPPSGSDGNFLSQAACFGGGRFVVVGDGMCVGVSTDATNWTAMRILTPLHQLLAVTYGDGLYVAVGRSGLIVTSPDGADWTVRTKGVVQNLIDVSPSDDGFIAVGENGAITISTNGLVWEVVPTAFSNALLAVIQAGGQYAVADNAGGIASGPDPASLVPRVTGTAVALNGLAFGAGKWIAVGNNGMILSTSETINWAPEISGTTNHLNAVEFGGGKFVAVGEYGTILSSSNGSVWTAGVSGTGLSLRGVAYGRGRYVAVSSSFFSSAAIFSSIDGLTWVPASGTFSPVGKIAFGNGWFLAAAQAGVSFPYFYASTDGRLWKSIPRGSNTFQPSVLTYNNGTFVSAYLFGVITQSDPVVDVEITHNGLAQLTVGGPKNATYQIEALDSLTATNLWQPLTVLSNAPYVWVDPQSAGTTNRVYRAVLLP